MKSMMWKTTLREIRQSFGRFFAIFAIVALGVGFFAGLKVTTTAMLDTVQEYWQEQQFFDLRLLSSVGFGQEEAEFLMGQDAVKAAEGAISFDILCEDSAGNQRVLKAHSMTGQVNRLVLEQGRMPEAANECVLDSGMADSYQVGDTLRLAANNEEEDLEHFACREYTIVGIVRSPIYIQFERGNTSLGNGRLSGYVYMLAEGFAVDYLTEIYVKFDRNDPIYSEVYKAYMEEKESQWEKLTEEAAQARLERMLEDAREELADAEAELAEEKEKAQAELEDARIKLADAEAELTDGERELLDGEEELADGRRTLEEKRQELSDGERTLAEEEEKLLDGEKQLAEGIEEWQENNNRIESAKEELRRQEEELNSQLALLEQQAVEIEAGLAQAALQEEELLGQENALDTQAQALDEQENQLNMLESMLLAQYGQIPEAEAAQIAQGRQEILGYRQQLEAGRVQLESGRAQLEAGRQQLNEGYARITQGRQQIAGYQQQIALGWSEIEEGDRQLAEAWEQIEESKAEIEEGREQIAEAKAELQDGRQKLQEAEEELSDGEQELLEARQELEDGRKEYEEGREEYENGVEEFEENIASAQEELDDARREIEETEQPDVYVLGRDTNVGYVCFESDSGIVDAVANVFPVFFFAVAALVCITTMNRMVEEQRTQIGVLKALGYGPGVIMGKYLFYSGSAALLGCLGGFFCGTWLFPKIIWTAYGMMYRVKPLNYIFDWKLAVIALLVSMGCSLGTTLLTCRHEMQEVAACLMRPKAPKAGKRVLLERIPFIWKNLKFLYKVSYRNIFRYKKRFCMMVIGISGCTALLVTGFGVKDSIADIADTQFEEIQLYDMAVTFAEPLTEEMEQELREQASDALGEYLPVMEKTVDLQLEEGIKSVTMIVPADGIDITPFLNLHTEENRPVDFPEEGCVVLNHKVAGDEGIGIGDTIILQDDKMRTITAQVSGINENFVYTYAYIDGDTYRTQLGEEPEYKTVYLNVSEGADIHQLSADLMKLDGVATVTVNEDTRARVSEMMKSLDMIVLVIIICAAGLAFIVLYNLTNINITERIREIATIKVLGFYRKETAAYVFRENMVLTLIGGCLGLVLGIWLHRFVMSEIRIDAMAFDIRVKPVSFLYSILLTFAFTWMVNRLMGRKLEQISMTESLKSVD